MSGINIGIILYKFNYLHLLPKNERKIAAYEQSFTKDVSN